MAKFFEELKEAQNVLSDGNEDTCECSCKMGQAYIAALIDTIAPYIDDADLIKNDCDNDTCLFMYQQNIKEKLNGIKAQISALQTAIDDILAIDSKVSGYKANNVVYDRFSKSQ